MAKRYHFNFRQTAAGHSTFDPADVTDYEVNDANHHYFTIIDGSPLYPTVGVDYITNYGKSSAIGTSSNNTLSNSGGSGHAYKQDLAGFNTWSTTGQGFQIDLDNGEYDIWLAFGSGSGNSNFAVVFDDSRANVNAGTPSYNAIATSGFRNWAATTAMTTSDYIVSSIDLTVWKCTTAGTSGATEPSGGVKDTTFNDGSAVWTNTGRVALARITGTNTGSTIIDHDNGVVAYASWPGTARRVTVANGSITITRGSSSASIRTVSVEKVLTPLQDVQVYNEFNVSDSTPDVYANQVEGYRAARLSFATGSTADITLTDTLAPYFSIERDDSDIYLVHNSVPLPSALVGTADLGIVQTDAGSSGSPYTTTITANVLSSSSRTNLNDGTVEGAICTQSWVNVARVETTHASDLWTGYNNETFLTDVAVDNDTDLRTEIDNAKAASTGSSWHRIRLQEGGTFVGIDTLTADFGATGGLLIEPDTGHDPEFNSQFYPAKVCGLHIRGVLIPGDKAVLANTSQGIFRCESPGATGISGNGRSNRFAATEIRFGVGFKLTMAYEDDKQISGYSAEAITARGSSFFMCDHAESVYINNCIFDGGVSVPLINLAATRCQYIGNNLFMRLTADICAISGIEYPTSTMFGFFADDNPYVMIEDNVVVRELGFPGRTSSAHADFIQLRTPAGNASFWYDLSGTNNDVGSPWAPGDLMFCRESNRWYEVASITTGITGATNPSTTGTGIVDGGVTWDFVSENTIAVPWYLVVRGNDMISSCSQMADDPARQFYIGSTGGFAIPVYASIYNNINSGSNDKGINFDEGYLYAEYNSFGGPPDFHPSSNYNEAKIAVDNQGVCISRKNICMGPSNFAGASLYYEYDLVDLEWDVSLSTGLTQPSAYLRGPFSTTTYNTTDLMYVVSGIDNSGEGTKSAVHSQIRNAFTTIQGDNGIWPETSNSQLKSSLRNSLSLGF